MQSTGDCKEGDAPLWRVLHKLHVTPREVDDWEGQQPDLAVVSQEQPLVLLKSKCKSMGGLFDSQSIGFGEEVDAGRHIKDIAGPPCSLRRSRHADYSAPIVGSHLGFKPAVESK